MNIYLISQDINNDYDTFDSAVVAAESEEAAKEIHPIQSWNGWMGPKETWKSGTWCKSSEQVTVKYLGQAAEGTPAGVLLASYNAG